MTGDSWLIAVNRAAGRMPCPNCAERGTLHVAYRDEPSPLTSFALAGMALARSRRVLWTTCTAEGCDFAVRTNVAPDENHAAE